MSLETIINLRNFLYDYFFFIQQVNDLFISFGDEFFIYILGTDLFLQNYDDNLYKFTFFSFLSFYRQFYFM